MIEEGVGEEMGGEFCVGDDELMEMRKMRKEVEEVYGDGVDMELGM